jgi:thiol-disulfide isomerase/thioredoxin
MTTSRLAFRPAVLGLVLGLALTGAALAQPVAAQPAPAPLGTALPGDVSLTRVADGQSAPLRTLTGATATVVVFWSNQCLWVDKYTDRLAALAGDVEGAAFVLVNANDAASFPKENLEASREAAPGFGTYVRDDGATLAQRLGATRTPHVFVFDGGGTLVYTGTIDDSPGDPDNVSQTYLRDALAALAAGEEVPVGQTKAFGCMLKAAN